MGEGIDREKRQARGGDQVAVKIYLPSSVPRYFGSDWTTSQDNKDLQRQRL